MQLILFMAMGVAILAVVFAIQNTSIILVNFMTWKFEGSLALILIFTFCFGVIAGLLTTIPSNIKKSKTILDQKKTIKKFKDTYEDQDDETEEITEL